MIKWPEPSIHAGENFGEWTFEVNHYAEAQLKQAARDAVEACARVADCRDLPATSAAIRALIKEIA